MKFVGIMVGFLMLAIVLVIAGFFAGFIGPIVGRPWGYVASGAAGSFATFVFSFAWVQFGPKR